MPTAEPLPDHPASIRDAWRWSAWWGDAAGEREALSRWRLASPRWLSRARHPSGVEPPDTWLAAATMERIAVWPTIRDHHPNADDNLDRIVWFSFRTGDPVETILGVQSVATDRLTRSLGPDSRLLRRVEEMVAECAEGTDRQRARACLNAAWAAWSTFDADATRRWAGTGLAELGELTTASPRPDREIALHLYNRAVVGLAPAQLHECANRMLALLRPDEHPTWRARALLRELEADVTAASPADRLAELALCAARSGKVRLLSRVAFTVHLRVLMGLVDPRDALQALETLLAAAPAAADPLLASLIRERRNDVARRVAEGTVLPTLPVREPDQFAAIAAGRPSAGSPQSDRLWARAALYVARALRELEQWEQAIQLTEHAVDIERTAGNFHAGAEASLTLARFWQESGHPQEALDALFEALRLAILDSDRDLQARAHAQIPSIILLRDGASAALAACQRAEVEVSRLLDQVAGDPQRRVEHRLLAWESLDLKRTRAQILASAGSVGQALAVLEGVDDAFLDLGYSPQAIDVLVTTARLAARFGRPAEADARWEKAVRLAESHDIDWAKAETISAWASWLNGQGRPDAAAEVRRRWGPAVQADDMGGRNDGRAWDGKGGQAQGGQAEGGQAQGGEAEGGEASQAEAGR